MVMNVLTVYQLNTKGGNFKELIVIVYVQPYLVCHHTFENGILCELFWKI